MDPFGVVLVGSGIVLGTIAKIWVLVLAFDASPGWGLCSLMPFGMPIFIATHWEDTQIPVVSLALPSFVLFASGLALIW